MKLEQKYMHLAEYDRVFETLLLNLFRLEQKTDSKTERHINKMRECISVLGYEYYDPIGDKYTEARLDLRPDRDSKARGKVVETYEPVLRKRLSDGKFTTMKPASVTVK